MTWSFRFSTELAAGAAVPLPPDLTFQDLRSYFAAKLDQITNFAHQPRSRAP